MSDAAGALKYLRKAERALEHAAMLLAAEATESACNRAYYAMHDAAHAALLATGFESLGAPIKTHQGLIGEFGKHIVRAGLLEADYGRSLNRVQIIRLAADYATDPPDLAEAVDAVGQAERFVAAVRHLIASQPA